MLGSDTTGVGQRYRVAREIIGGQCAISCPLHDVLVGDQEVGEAHVLRTLDTGDDKTAGAIGFGHIDGDTEVDVRGVNGDRFTVHFVIENVLAR